MDRLICGDAGFGKTEVALRAAFIAVMDGRQVAVLVPTTVLAEQHWNTFRDALQGLPGAGRDGLALPHARKENKAVIEDVRARQGRYRDRHPSPAARATSSSRSSAC